MKLRERLENSIVSVSAGIVVVTAGITWATVEKLRVEPLQVACARQSDARAEERKEPCPSENRVFLEEGERWSALGCDIYADIGAFDNVNLPGSAEWDPRFGEGMWNQHYKPLPGEKPVWETNRTFVRVCDWLDHPGPALEPFLSTATRMRLLKEMPLEERPYVWVVPEKRQPSLVILRLSGEFRNCMVQHGSSSGGEEEWMKVFQARSNYPIPVDSASSGETLLCTFEGERVHLVTQSGSWELSINKVWNPPEFKRSPTSNKDLVLLSWERRGP